MSPERIGALVCRLNLRIDLQDEVSGRNFECASKLRAAGDRAKQRRNLRTCGNCLLRRTRREAWRDLQERAERSIR